MPSAPSEAVVSQPAPASLPLAPVASITRPLSLPEYYHASIGSSRHTLEQPRMTAYFLRGEGQLREAQWRAALDQVAAVNPGARLRLEGRLYWARWRSDGPPPGLRMLDRCDWDLRSSRGAEFVEAVPLSLEQGPAIELVVAQHIDGSTLLVLRAHHAVADGIGSMHLLEELFRALRGEPLLGSNAGFSDTDLMLSVGGKPAKSPRLQINWLTGDPQGDEQGDEWRRISLGRPGKNLLARTAAAMAEFHHRHSPLPILLAVPVNLRRHAPGLRAVTNFSNMLRVPLYLGDGPEQFSQRLKEMLAQRVETAYSRVLDLFKLLPFHWIDRMLSRTLKNYRTKKALESAVISYLGRFDSAVLSCPGFRAEEMFVRPLGGSVFSTMICIDDQLEMTLNLPRVLASGGRFDALEAHLRERLSG